MGYFYPACRAVIGFILDGFDKGNDQPAKVTTVPAMATVYRNQYKQADSWSVEFDATDMPVHPAQIRTGEIALFMYQTEGLAPFRRGDLLARTPTVVGLFDQTGMTYNSDERTFTIEGQDFTALFIGKQWTPGRRIPSGKRLSRVLEELIREADPPRGGRGGILSLDYRASVDPIIGSVESPTVKRKGRTPQNAKTLWDVMYQLATAYGLIAFVEGYSLVITTPRTRFTEADVRLRKMAWGKNIDQIEINRNMGKDRTPQIKVLSWDPVKQRTVTGLFPTKARPAKTGIGTNFEEVQTYFVDGIVDQDTLNRYAEAVYDQRARGEHQIIVRTADLKDVDAKDLLDVRTGDPMQVAFDPFNVDEINALGSEAARASFLEGRGFRPEVAALFAANMRSLVSFRKPLRVREATYDWSIDDGIEVEVELQEFVSPDVPR